MKKQKVIPILFDTYIAVIKNSVGSNIFRNLYAKVNGKKTDITENGNLSCALFVSSVIYWFKLIKNLHATVDGVVKDLEESGWKKVEKPRVGSIIVWEKNDFGGGDLHKHIGFYIENKKAISNSPKLKHPVEHHCTFGASKNKPARKIESIWWNNKLNKV